MPKRPSLDYQYPYAEPPAPPPPHSPFAVMLTGMRRKFDADDLNGVMARIAAPYVDPRNLPGIPAAALASLPDADPDAVDAQD